jgi:hypothetical protein
MEGRGFRQLVLEEGRLTPRRPLTDVLGLTPARGR